MCLHSFVSVRFHLDCSLENSLLSKNKLNEIRFEIMEVKREKLVRRKRVLKSKCFENKKEDLGNKA